MIYLSYESHVVFAAPILKFKPFFFFATDQDGRKQEDPLGVCNFDREAKQYFSPLKHIEELFKCKITIIPFFTNWNAYPLLRTLLSLWINFI